LLGDGGLWVLSDRAEQRERFTVLMLCEQQAAELELRDRDQAIFRMRVQKLAKLLFGERGSAPQGGLLGGTQLRLCAGIVARQLREAADVGPARPTRTRAKCAQHQQESRGSPRRIKKALQDSYRHGRPRLHRLGQAATELRWKAWSRTVRELLRWGMRKVVVLRHKLLSPSVIGLRLACIDGEPIAFVPGQWVTLHVAAGGEVEKRPYSIASAPDSAAPDTFELAVTLVEAGRVSTALHAMQPGDVLLMDGPYGFFTREDHAAEDALMVGTGTGVAPLRSMVHAALAAPAGPRLTLLFGCRTQADLLYQVELEALTRQHERFRFEPTLSRADADWSGRRGYVQTHLQELIPGLGRPHVYVCGLSNMVNAVRGVLKETLGYDRKHIHTERYD
jgi:ferredoxin-NADP reductase